MAKKNMRKTRMKKISFWKPTKIKKRKVRPISIIQKNKFVPIRKKDLNWKQAKRKYPKLHPFGDADKDKIRNWKDCKPFDKKRQGWAHSGTAFSRERSTHVVMMRPEKFLRTTVREGMNNYGRMKGRQMRFENLSKEDIEEYNKEILDRKNIEKLKKILKKEEEKVPVPFLEYDEQGKPIGHEGRHRAKAAEELGIERIPVTIARRLKRARDWKHIREGRISEDGRVYTRPHKKQKKDWRNDLENEDEITSSESADIPIEEQKEYGKEKPEALQKINYEEEE